MRAQISQHTFNKIDLLKAKGRPSAGPFKPCKQSERNEKQHRRLLQATVQEQAHLPANENGRKQPGLIFAPNDRTAWDSGAVSNPVKEELRSLLQVRCYFGDNGQRWMMWYDGCTAEPEPGLPVSSIGLATSPDGVRWQRGSTEPSDAAGNEALSTAGRVLTQNPDWWWHDTRHVSVSDVQIFSSDAVNTGVGVYWMFYTGGNFEEAAIPAGLQGLEAGTSAEGLRTRIGLAMSQDGSNWARIEADHHSGALFDAGQEGEWDECLNGAPQVEALGRNDLRMYYHTYMRQAQRWAVGLATSRDGFKWVKKGPLFEGSQRYNFDARGPASHCIVKDPDARRYVMFYESVSEDDTRSISMAVSRDGLKDWKCLGKPVLSPGVQNAWDAGGVGCPCAVSMEGGRWRLYYSGKRDITSDWQSIGLAITDIEYSERFEGVETAFKRINIV